VASTDQTSDWPDPVIGVVAFGALACVGVGANV
jgi:hypothetical protein